MSYKLCISTLLFSMFLSPLKAQEVIITIYLHNGTIFETPISEIDSIKFSGQKDGVVINGVRWATRNLAAHGVFCAKSEDYGALFQWGRRGDMHEQRTSPNYPTNDNSSENGAVSSSGLDANGQIINTHAAYGKFIKQNDELWDWRSPQKDDLWNSGKETAPQKTANDPCPAGWRVPTKAELESLVTSGNEWDDLKRGRYFGSETNKIFLPASGGRNCGRGEVNATGDVGFYWCSTVVDVNVHYLYFYSENVYVDGGGRAAGFSVRCVAE